MRWGNGVVVASALVMTAGCSSASAIGEGQWVVNYSWNLDQGTGPNDMSFVGHVTPDTTIVVSGDPSNANAITFNIAGCDFRGSIETQFTYQLQPTACSITVNDSCQDAVISDQLANGQLNVTGGGAMSVDFGAPVTATCNGQPYAGTASLFAFGKRP